MSNINVTVEDVNINISTETQGPAGTPGLVWKGAYSNVTAYIVRDVVEYQGSSYYCKLASTGNIPTNTTYWDLVAGTGGAGPGDMTKAVYDPTNVNDDAFSMGNMAETATKKILTDTERTKLAGVEAGATNDTTATIKAKLGTASTSTDGYLTQTDWDIFNEKQNALGFTPENVANKENTTLDTSSTKYPTNRLVKEYVDNATIPDATTLVKGKIKLAGDLDGTADLPTIGVNKVTNAKLAQMPTKTYKGRTSSGTGNAEDLTVSQVKADLAIENVDNTSDVNKPVSTAQAIAIGLKEDSANKATDFSIVNHTLFPSVQAVKTYADSLVTGLLDYRGGYDASGNTFPTTGGSGTAGAILKGDMFIISVIGTLGGQAVQVGDSVIASVDTPGQTAGNWNILNSNIAYVPEDVANKENTTLDTSPTKYPTNRIVKEYADTKVTANASITGATKTKITYDSKGLVTAGADATTADIADSLNKRYVTDADLVDIGNLSGVNTGDNSVNTLYDRRVKNLMSTALLTGPVTMTVGSPTSTFSIPSFTAQFVDNYTNPAVPVLVDYTFPGATNLAITNLLTQDLTYISIDKNGVVYQSATFNSGENLRDRVGIGTLGHASHTAVDFIDTYTANLAWDISAGLSDISMAIGFINSGNRFSGNGANLKVNKATGTTTYIGLNSDSSNKSPNITVDSALNAPVIYQTWRNGTGGWVTNLSDTLVPGKYDNNTAGGITSPNGVLAVNKWQLLKVYYSPALGLSGVEYGQVIYNSLAEAEAATSTDTDLNPLFQGTSFRGWIILRGGATSLQNVPADCVFKHADKFGNTVGGSSSGSSTTTMQQAYENSVTPQITTNATLGSVDYRNGAGADTLNVFRILNSAGTPTNVINGLGWTGIGTNAPTGSLDIHATVYNPGTVSVSGTGVTGVGTAFTKTFKQGDSITTTTTSGSETREIVSITSDTVMATVSAFTGTSSNTVYSSSNIGTQLLVLPNGNIRPFGSPGSAINTVNDWINKSNTVNITGNQQICAFRDQTTINQTVGVTGNINTFVCLTQINATGTGRFGAVRGFNSAPTVLSTNTGNITTIAPLLSAAQIQAGATGTITNSIGVLINPLNASTTNIVTNQYGIQIAPTQNGGTLTSYSGIAIAAKPTAATNSTLLLLNTTVIPSGTWGIYSTSTANNYLAGILGLGATPFSDTLLRLGGTIGTATALYGVYSDSTIPATTTVQFNGFTSVPTTAASSFVLGSLRHFRAVGATLGSTSAITDQYGFFVDSSLNVATNNHGFYGNIAAATGRWNIHMAGTAQNYFAGKVGIGITVPVANLDIFATDAKLRVRDVGQTNGLEIYQQNSDGGSRIFTANNNYLAFGTNNTERARILAGGNFIKGHTASVNTLVEAALQVHGTGADGYVSISRWSTNAATPGLIFAKSRGASIGTRGVLSADDSLGSIDFTGDDGTNFVSGAQIKAFVDGTPGTNDMPSRIAFYTTPDGSSTLSERMRINSSGNLGIGVTSPTATLHLKAGTATASTAPIKLTAGTNMTTPENGAIEFDGTNIFITVGGVRKTFTIV